MDQATLEAMSEADASVSRGARGANNVGAQGARGANDVGCFVGIASSDYEALCERSQVQVSEGVK